MIVCNKRKISVVLNPKTGTTTLCNIFKNLEVDECLHDHKTLDKNLVDHQVFSFYRDPVDRFLSSARYYKRRYYVNLIHAIYGNKIKISCLTTTPYDLLEDDIKRAIESISIRDILESNCMNSNELFFKPQTSWLDHPNTVLLNYHEYESEVMRLLSYFDYYNFDIPRLNESIKLPQYDQVDTNTIAKIQDLYRTDYDFFASKGITFSS